ncbi:T9SS type B sorting domain-containing protein, partial [Flavobacterium sp. RHBU_3]|uniref:T9SS type B sorting domain-containing protein n=1 Tax=Flavobacterium sp. RHBU_3 TaxID=3391184 RepID=UPI003984D7BC
VECGTLIIENVSVIDYPRFFTPNGDGFNDTWNIQGMTEGYSDTNIFIFDRYGKLLKQISPSGEGWDGTYNGAALPSDDYWFTVEYTYNGHRLEFKAHFAMKR